MKNILTPETGAPLITGEKRRRKRKKKILPIKQVKRVVWE